MAASKGINILVQIGTAAATDTLTFTGGVSDAEIVTIGARVYEFDTAGTETITAGRVRVNVSGGAGAAAAVAALVAAINADTGAVVTAVDGALDTVVVTAKEQGTGGNSIVATTTCADATWGGAGLLTGGAVTTLALQRNGSIRLNMEPIDITTKSDAIWKGFLAGHVEGEITCDGLLSPNDASQEALQAAQAAQTPVTVKFSHNSGVSRYYHGKFLITSLEQRAAHDGVGEYSASLKLTGTLSYVDA